MPIPPIVDPGDGRDMARHHAQLWKPGTNDRWWVFLDPDERHMKWVDEELGAEWRHFAGLRYAAVLALNTPISVA